MMFTSVAERKVDAGDFRGGGEPLPLDVRNLSGMSWTVQATPQVPVPLFPTAPMIPATWVPWSVVVGRVSPVGAIGPHGGVDSVHVVAESVLSGLGIDPQVGDEVGVRQEGPRYRGWRPRWTKRRGE